MVVDNEMQWEDDERSPYQIRRTHVCHTLNNDWFTWYVSRYIFSDRSADSFFKDIVLDTRYPYGHASHDAPPYYIDPDFMEWFYVSQDVDSTDFVETRSKRKKPQINESLFNFLHTGTSLSRLKTTCYTNSISEVIGNN